MTAGRGARVLVAGDLNVDLVLRGDVRPRFGQVEQLLDDGSLVLGSSAGIAASALARLGVETSLVAVVGNDAFGRFCRDTLTASGVDDRAVRTVEDHATGITVILSEPGDRAILTAIGALGDLTAEDVLSAAEGHDHVHFASPYLTPRLLPRMTEVLRTLRGEGVSTSMDTNWDPAGSWQELGALLPMLDVYLPNVQELRAAAAALSLSQGSDRNHAAAIAALGPDVVVKDGAHGGWSADANGVFCEVQARPTEVVDTTGAGDSFDAGYLAARLDGQDPRERLRWAVASGSLSTRGSGGTATQASRDEVLEARPA